MLRIAIALMLAAASTAAIGQDAGSEDSEDDSRLSGKAALGYLSTSGNTDSTNANASFSLVYALERWRHEFDVSAVGASSNDQTTAEAYLLEHEARRAYGEHHFLFTAFSLKEDRFSGYERQVSQTVGYGRRLVEAQRHVLDAGLGLGARQSLLRDGREEDDGIVRGSIDYVWDMTETAQFEQALVAESGSTNTMLESRSALRARIIGNISLVLSYRLRRNTAVPVSAAREDRFTSIALEYAF